MDISGFCDRFCPDISSGCTYKWRGICGTVCVVLISQEQLERMVEGAEQALVDRYFDEQRPGGVSVRTLQSRRHVRWLLEAALMAGGVEVGVDPRLERHRAEQAPGSDLAVLRVVAETTCHAGPTTLFLADGSGNVYRVSAERL